MSSGIGGCLGARLGLLNVGRVCGWTGWGKLGLVEHFLCVL